MGPADFGALVKFLWLSREESFTDVSSSGGSGIRKLRSGGAHQSGDETAVALPDSKSRQIERWFLELRDPLLRYLRTIGCEPSLVEEIAHETFFRLHRALHDDVQIQDARAWLFRVARNLWIDSRRDQQRFLAADRENHRHASPAADPEQQALYRERLRMVASRAAGLPRLDRECLLLRARGLRYREIASTLDIPLTAVVECVRRAVKTIRGQIAKSELPHRGRGRPSS